MYNGTDSPIACNRIEEAKNGESEHIAGSIVDSVLDEADGSCMGSTHGVGQKHMTDHEGLIFA